MKLVECLALIITLSLFGSFFASVFIPLYKNSIQIKKIEKDLERDRFIVNAVNKLCRESEKEKLTMKENELISNCCKTWNLDSFYITENQTYYRAEWSCNNKSLIFLVNKEY